MVYSLHEIQQKLKRNTPLLYDELLRPQTNEKKKKKKKILLHALSDLYKTCFIPYDDRVS